MRDMLPIMVSSVSSERAFSSAGITISKCRNRLKPDIVEASQFLKCSYHHNLLFHEEPNTQRKLDELDEDTKEIEEGWEALVEDLADVEGVVTIVDDDAGVQDISA